MRLRITWDGGSAVFEPTDPVHVGRGPEATITLSDSLVSRAHVRFFFGDEMWVFEDLSSNGTFIDGQRVTIGALGGLVVMNLGTATGPSLRVEPLPAQVPRRPHPPAPSPSSPVSESTMHREPTVPTSIGSIAHRVDDRKLRLELDGRAHEFSPGRKVTIGRDRGCDVRSASQLVSGTHCRFEHDGTHWTIEDLGSTRGTWIDGRRVTRARVEGAFIVMLGDDDAGEPLRVITAGVHRKARDRRPMLLAALALAVAIGGVVAILLLGGGTDQQAIDDLRRQLEEERRQSADQIAAAEERADAAIAAANARGGAGNSPSELMAARLSTGLISLPGPDGEIIPTGSGALVTADGLVLTNIHVARPELEYQRTGDPAFAGLEDPDTLFVAFPSEDGGPADRYFVAEQHSAHPAHDAALIRIVDALDDGVSLDDLPDPLPLGESGLLRAGDQIAVVGYPGTAFTDRVSVALSNFQSFQPCFEGSDLDRGWGCLRDYEEGYLNLAGETLEGGSSGGPIVREGRIVGIQLGVFGTPGAGSGQNLGVPVDLISDELDVG